MNVINNVFEKGAEACSFTHTMLCSKYLDNDLRRKLVASVVSIASSIFNAAYSFFPFYGSSSVSIRATLIYSDKVLRCVCVAIILVVISVNAEERSFTHTMLCSKCLDNDLRWKLVASVVSIASSIFDAAYSFLAFCGSSIFILFGRSIRTALIHLAQVVQYVCLAILLPPTIIISLDTARKLSSFSLFPPPSPFKYELEDIGFARQQQRELAFHEKLNGIGIQENVQEIIKEYWLYPFPLLKSEGNETLKKHGVKGKSILEIYKDTTIRDVSIKCECMRLLGGVDHTLCALPYEKIMEIVNKDKNENKKLCCFLNCVLVKLAENRDRSGRRWPFYSSPLVIAIAKLDRMESGGAEEKSALIKAGINPYVCRLKFDPNIDIGTRDHICWHTRVCYEGVQLKVGEA